MTDYEAQSLQIASDTFLVYLGADFIAFGALVAAIWGGKIAFSTLNQIRQQLDIAKSSLILISQQLESAKWNALLAFEQDINARRQRYADIMHKKKSSENPDEYNSIYTEAEESYLNAVDRLATCILNGQFPELEMKTDYRKFITDTIREHPDKFVAGTLYRKILKLDEKWQD